MWAIDPGKIKLSFDALDQRQHYLEQVDSLTGYTEGRNSFEMNFVNAVWKGGTLVYNDQSSHRRIADGEGWPCLIAENASGKSALTKKIGNISWHARWCALFNFAILREIKNG